MALQKAKPTSAGRRFVVKFRTPDLHTGQPHEPLVAKKSKSGGRNNAGRITTRHRGGGHKRAYRVIDFKRTKRGVPATVERLEYDPNRSAHIALLKYADGERRYIIAPKGMQIGDPVRSGIDAPIIPGILPIDEQRVLDLALDRLGAFLDLLADTVKHDELVSEGVVVRADRIALVDEFREIPVPIQIEVEHLAGLQA